MFHIKWWVFVIIEMHCFHISNNFECHFEPNQKYQSDMDDPVGFLFTYNFDNLQLSTTALLSDTAGGLL